MNLSIDKKWKWAAMDRDGQWTFYVDKPFIGHDEWTPTISAEESIPGRLFVTVSTIVNGFPYCHDWRDSLHQIINNQLVKFELPKEPPAVIRAREILEECGIVDVQGTPADQLQPLIDLIEEVALCRYDKSKETK